MVRTPEKNFLRAWREHRRMTQAQLAEAVGTTGAVISLLESGQRGLGDKWLRRLAPVLGASPGHLLEIDPDDAPNDILEIWAGIPEDKRPQVREIMKTFSGDPTITRINPSGKPTPGGSNEAQKPKATRKPKGPKGV
jgi:transcriptional regulator with XRE-family HTH domain